jgi:hypothetical protein
MSVREDAHNVLDALPDDQVPAALDLLRKLAHAGGVQETRRRGRVFQSMGVGHAEHDLGARAKEIARQELGQGQRRA